jgi:hypothetical protein
MPTKREEKGRPATHSQVEPNPLSLHPTPLRNTMAPAKTSQNRSSSVSTAPDSTRSSPIPGTATRANTRRNGVSIIIEELQDIKDPIGGRKYLEKHSLLCPPGEPPSHTSLATCLHQISALAGLAKPVINAIRAVAFLLDELEETQINTTVKRALDSQITEFTSDMQLLIQDAKEKIDIHIKAAEERLTQHRDTPAQPESQATPTLNTRSYASILINPPAHANPRIAAKEGIKARQFAIEGIKNSKFSHLDNIQLKAELNKILLALGLSSGGLRSVTSSRSGSTIIEAESDDAAKWIATGENQHRICEEIGANTIFRTRTYNIMALNVPLVLDPDNDDHRLEICEANNLDQTAITSIKWAKAINKRSPTQRTAHLLLTFSNADAANRAITSGLHVCNRQCHMEKVKREPTRCLKCQGWNHLAKECLEEHDRCSNCGDGHRANKCRSETRYCVSCRSNDHASWSRACLAFIRKTEDFNSRNPDNSLQFFPTADSWTWSPSFNHNPYPTAKLKGNPPAQAHMKISKTQAGKRPERPHQPPPASQHSQHRRQYDTYIPADTYIPTYSSLVNTTEQSTLDDWWANPTSSNTMRQGTGTGAGPGSSSNMNRTLGERSNNA